jgi:hypothetical protein
VFLVGFKLWVRRKLGANQPQQSSIAVTLESRRLKDYLSWPVEALLFLIIVLSWFLILTRGDAQSSWEIPVVMTYVVLGLFPGKMGLIRHGFPLPAKQTEEHYRQTEAYRRYSLRVLGSFQWLMVIILAGYALQHSWPAVKAQIWFRPLLIIVALGAWLVMAGLIIRGERHLAATGRDLRPVGNWSGPFHARRMFSTSGWIWSGAYFAGLVFLMAWIFMRG